MIERAEQDITVTAGHRDRQHRLAPDRGQSALCRWVPARFEIVRQPDPPAPLRSDPVIPAMAGTSTAMETE